MKGMKQYPILAWHYCGFNRSPKQKVEDWHDMGLNIVTAPVDLNHKEIIREALDLAAGYNMKLILFDPRTGWRTLTKVGEEEYRKGVAEAIADFGSHPGVFGFYIGDEPDAPDAADAFKALRINEEMAPHLTAFLNLLPWFDWIGPRMGTDAYAPYLDRASRESNAKILSYDCYAQMWDDKAKAYRDYFNNLREYYENYKRNGMPFINTVLCIGHFSYRCPSKDDLLWQLTTSVAQGAAGVMWFHIEQSDLHANYRNAPINVLGDRTTEFGWMREVNCVFNNYVGEIMATLSIDKCYHVGEAYGGMPLFEPFDNIVDVKSSETPLIVSSFHNEAGERFYVVCNNSPETSTHVSMKVTGEINLTQCVYGNRFAPISLLSDPIGEKMNVPGQSLGFLLAPGQMALLKEEKK